MEFSKVKCKILHLVCANMQYYYRLENEWIGSKPAEKNVEVLIDEPKMLVLAAQEANR